MKYINTAILLSILFSGCSTMTPIQKASDSKSQFGGGVYTGTQEKGIELKNKEVYRVFHRGSTGFTPLSAVRNSAEKRADYNTPRNQDKKNHSLIPKELRYVDYYKG